MTLFFPDLNVWLVLSVAIHTHSLVPGAIGLQLITILRDYHPRFS